MKRKLLMYVVIMVAYPALLMAVPAKRGIVKTLTTKDGATVEATLVGDENVHYYRTKDGRCLQMVDGAYEFVSIDSLTDKWNERLQTRNSVRRARAMSSQRTSYTGSRKGLVILVNFANLSMNTEREEWDNYFNQEGYGTAGMWGSVHDYFYEQSYGMFDLTFDVVGPVTVSNDYQYYGDDENNAPYMVKEACQAVDGQVNFNDYDWDGDGYVDQVLIVYAGYGEAQGADEDTIWPHEWGLSAIPATRGLRLDGVVIDTYTCTPEFHGDGKRNTGIIDGIGTACHEFSHCLGLPDFYDTASDANFGMDVWSVLDYGNYNGGGGYVPAAFTAYERYYSGWLELTELSSATRVEDMPCITDEPCAYIIRNDAYDNEFYILQNIQQTGFNSEAYGHGLLILHVDYDATVWNNNTVNTVEDHQRMTIFAADNRYAQYSVSADGDPFPGTSGATSFTDDTLPASSLYNANSDGTYYMGKPIENITESDGYISFDFMSSGDGISAPMAYASHTDGGEAIYDLSGRQVATPERGIYIKNGKKFVK